MNNYSAHVRRVTVKSIGGSAVYQPALTSVIESCTHSFIHTYTGFNGCDVRCISFRTVEIMHSTIAHNWPLPPSLIYSLALCVVYVCLYGVKYCVYSMSRGCGYAFYQTRTSFNVFDGDYACTINFSQASGYHWRQCVLQLPTTNLCYHLQLSFVFVDIIFHPARMYNVCMLLINTGCMWITIPHPALTSVVIPN